MTVHHAMQLLLVAVITVAWVGASYVYLRGVRDRATIVALSDALEAYQELEQNPGCAHDGEKIPVESLTGEVVAHICMKCDAQIE